EVVDDDGRVGRGERGRADVRRTDGVGDGVADARVDAAVGGLLKGERRQGDAQCPVLDLAGAGHAGGRGGARGGVGDAQPEEGRLVDGRDGVEGDGPREVDRPARGDDVGALARVEDAVAVPVDPAGDEAGAVRLDAAQGVRLAGRHVDGAGRGDRVLVAAGAVGVVT